jgi:hypothetical protein
MILFALVPAILIGWIIMPIGTAIAIWIAFRKVKGDTLRYYCLVALVWLLIAVLGDYLFIVKAFKPADGFERLAKIPLELTSFGVSSISRPKRSFTGKGNGRRHD